MMQKLALGGPEMQFFFDQNLVECGDGWVSFDNACYKLETSMNAVVTPTDGNGYWCRFAEAQCRPKSLRTNFLS
jgi:hypothetical protein